MTTTSQIYYETLCGQLRGSIDRCIQEIQSVGFSNEEAIGLLIRQACLRIDDDAIVGRTLMDILKERLGDEASG